MNRQQLLDRVECAWEAFNASYSGLTEAQLTEPGVAGDWSVKDILAHVSWWEAEALKHLPGIVEGRWPPRYSVTYGGIDAFNARMYEQKRDLSLATVCRELDDTHQRLLDLLERVPEEQLTRETRFRRRLRLDTYGHYPLHTDAIRAWRERRFAG